MRNTFLNKLDPATPYIEGNSLILCTAIHMVEYLSIHFLLSEQLLFGTLHCAVFLAHTVRNTVEETAI